MAYDQVKQYNEDDPHTTGDKGMQLLAVRSDAGAALAANGDYIPLMVNASGALFVTGGGGGTEYTEDIAAPADPVGGTLMMTRDDQLATVTEIEGDWSRLRSTSKGALWVALADSAGDPITSFGGGIQYTEGDIDATITGTAMMMEVAANTLQPVQGTVADGLLVNLGTNNDVTVASLPLPTGASTSANQTTIIGHVDGIEALLTTIDTDTGDIAVDADAIRIAVQLIDDAAVVLGTATYTEATSTGLAIGAVRRDADTTLVSLTNEWGPLQMDANGRLKVEVFSGETLPVSLASTTITGTVAVTQSGAWDVTVAELPAAAAITDNFANPTTTSVMAMNMVWDGATWDRAAGNSADGTLVNLGTNNDVTVTGSVSITGAVDTELPAAAALADAASAAPTTPTVGAIGLLMNATTVDRQRAVVNALNSTGTGIAGAGLVAQFDDTTPTTVTENQFGNVRMSANGVLYVGGSVAQDIAIAGNPMPSGYRASAAEPTAMSADGDAVYPWADRKGRTVVTMQAATGTQTSVAGSATNVTLLASNTSRKGALIYNDSTAILYVRLQATATTSNFSVKMFSDDTYEVPFGYTGIIDGIWASAAGNARITEIT